MGKCTLVPARTTKVTFLNLSVGTLGARTFKYAYVFSRGRSVHSQISLGYEHKYTKVMWLCKSKEFHNFFTRVYKHCSISEGKGATFPWFFYSPTVAVSWHMFYGVGLWWLVQPRLTAPSTGHICNEGRISRSLVQWIHINNDSKVLTKSMDRIGTPIGFQSVPDFPALPEVTCVTWAKSKSTHVASLQFLPTGQYGLCFGYCFSGPFPL